MNTRSLGSTGLRVSAIGLGCMGMSEALRGRARDQCRELAAAGDRYDAHSMKTLDSERAS